MIKTVVHWLIYNQLTDLVLKKSVITVNTSLHALLRWTFCSVWAQLYFSAWKTESESKVKNEMLMHRIYSEYKARLSSMHNLICRSGILHSTNWEQLRQTALTWDKKKILPLLVTAELNIAVYSYLLSSCADPICRTTHTISNTTS